MILPSQQFLLSSAHTGNSCIFLLRKITRSKSVRLILYHLNVEKSRGLASFLSEQSGQIRRGSLNPSFMRDLKGLLRRVRSLYRHLLFAPARIIVFHRSAIIILSYRKSNGISYKIKTKTRAPFYGYPRLSSARPYFQTILL